MTKKMKGKKREHVRECSNLCSKQTGEETLEKGKINIKAHTFRQSGGLLQLTKTKTSSEKIILTELK